MTSPERRKLVQNDLTYAAQIGTSLHRELGLALTAERGEIHSGDGATGLPAPLRRSALTGIRDAFCRCCSPAASVVWREREGGGRGREGEEGVFIQGNTHALTHSRCFSSCQLAALSNKTNWCVNDWS